MWKPIYQPEPWLQFQKRKDIVNLPLMEQRKKYMEEQLLFESYLSNLNTLNTTSPSVSSAASGGGGPKSIKPSPTPKDPRYLLNQTNKPALVAGGLRVLDQFYSGSLIRVKRSSDNTEQDIGFDPVSLSLDTGSLLEFVGTGSTDTGFVVTLYNQTKNKYSYWSAPYGNPSGTASLDLTSFSTPSIYARPPIIVENGEVLLSEKNKPYMKGEGDRYLKFRESGSVYGNDMDGYIGNGYGPSDTNYKSLYYVGQLDVKYRDVEYSLKHGLGFILRLRNINKTERGIAPGFAVASLKGDEGSLQDSDPFLSVDPFFHFGNVDDPGSNDVLTINTTSSSAPVEGKDMVGTAIGAGIIFPPSPAGGSDDRGIDRFYEYVIWEHDVTNDVTNLYNNISSYYNFSNSLNDSNFQTAVDLWFDSRNIVETQYGPIGEWDTTAVTNMSGAFEGRSSFNEDISAWDVSNVTNMQSMFSSASAFNQDISGWDVSAVTNMSNMFFSASSFNQNIGSWNISNVVDMTNMLTSASLTVPNYDALLIGWASQSVQPNVIFGAFPSQYEAEASRDILINPPNNWTITDAGNAPDALNDSNFSTAVNLWFSNQPAAEIQYGPIGEWDTTAVTNMSGAFSGRTTFNEDISAWDVGSVTNMNNMFLSASSFNQNIGGWDISSTTSMIGMLGGITLSTPNYDALLIGWASQSVQPNVIFDGGSSKYTLNASSSHDVLTGAPNNWTIIDGGGRSALNNSNFQTAVNLWFSDQPAAEEEYGPIGEWDTTAVTNMSGAFEGRSSFNEDISAWGVSSVTNMNSMFNGASAFNQNIGNWDVDSVTSMENMFNGASAFNQNIGNWDVSQVTTMNGMFNGASVFNQNIGNWDVSSVTNMTNMFRSAPSFNQDIGNWDVSNVVTTSGMFYGASTFNQNISSWDVSSVTAMDDMFNSSPFDQNIGGWNIGNVTSMIGMFANVTLSTPNYDALLIGWATQPVQSNVIFDGGLSGYSITAVPYRDVLINPPRNWTIADNGQVFTALNDSNFSTAVNLWFTNQASAEAEYGPIEGWNTSAVTNMSSAFSFRTSFNEDISAWDVSNVTTMQDMFRNATAFNQDISAWDVSSVTNMYRMFYRAYAFNQPLNTWDVSSVTNMSQMFRDTQVFNGNINTWDVSSVTNMSDMFNNADSFNQDIGGWNVGSVTNMQYMFRDTPVFNQDIGSWDVSSVALIAGMFYNADAFNQDISGWDVSSVLNTYQMFRQASAFNQPLDAWDVSNITNMSEMFQGATSFNQSLNSWDVSNVTGMTSMFSQASAFNGDISNWDVSNVTQISNMFYNADSFNQDISGWDVSSVINMSGMFAQMNSFNQDISNWDVSSVTNMTGLFSYAGAFNQDIGSWNVSNVTNMSNIFLNASVFNQDIGDWDVSSVTNMSLMFNGANAFNQNIGGWNVSAVTTMQDMFRNNSSFNQDISGWDVSNVTNFIGFLWNNSGFNNNSLNNWDVSSATRMDSMFRQNTTFNGDISSWNVSSVTSMNYMFWDSNFNGDISNWDVSSVTEMGYMFRNNSTFNQDIGNWDVSNLLVMYYAFENATSFNQDLSTWNVSNLASAFNAFNNSGLSTTNYSNLLIGWAAQTLKPNGRLDATGIQYDSSAVTARGVLTSAPNNWTITDGGQAP